MSKHHLLFIRKDFNKGYAHKLRRVLVYEIPDDIHVDLHNSIPPVPPITEWQARTLYMEYSKQDIHDVFDALEWLIDNAPSEEFRIAMINQALYLRCRM